MGDDWEEQKENFCDDGNVLYLDFDFGGRYMVIYKCDNSLKCILWIMPFTLLCYTSMKTI